MPLDWDKLRVFHAVAEAGSFTHAGETLNLSQSAVSRQIQALEEALQVPLFHRHARGLILTEPGETLNRTVREVFAKLAMTEALLTESKEKPAGRLKVTTTVEPGIVINPLQMKRNAEGGVMQGVSETLMEQVRFNKSTITSRDWVSFPILRMIDMPKTEIIVLNNPSVGSYAGAGEGPNGFVAAAITSAVFDATGKQPRRLPLLPKYVKSLLST